MSALILTAAHDVELLGMDLAARAGEGGGGADNNIDYLVEHAGVCYSISCRSTCNNILLFVGKGIRSQLITTANLLFF